MNYTIDTGELRAVANQVRTASSLVTERMRTGLQELEPLVEYASVGELRAVTPGASTSEGSLGSTTVARSVVSGLTLTTLLAQTKTVHSLRQDKDFLLSLILIRGRKALTGADRITPFTKHALFWEGALEGHPWASVQQPARPPDPYPDQAIPPIRSALVAIGQRYGRAILTGLLGLELES